jgi:hypothetical protein
LGKGNGGENLPKASLEHCGARGKALSRGRFVVRFMRLKLNTFAKMINQR